MGDTHDYAAVNVGMTRAFRWDIHRAAHHIGKVERAVYFRAALTNGLKLSDSELRRLVLADLTARVEAEDKAPLEVIRFKVEPEQLDALNALAARLQVSKYALCRAMLTHAMANMKDQQFRQTVRDERDATAEKKRARSALGGSSSRANFSNRDTPVATIARLRSQLEAEQRGA